jgi:hypothetical protein
MRTEFNKLANVLERYDLTEYGDELDIALKNLKDKIDEVENRLTCVIETNKDTRQILKSFAYGIVDKGLDSVDIHSDQFEILQRSCNDIDIAIDMNDTECIENNWYKLFKPKKSINMIKVEIIDNVSRETIEPPTDLCETYEVVEDKDLVNDIIEKLKFIDVDGETMQYILEQVGMEEQMHRQLVMKYDYKETKDLLREKFEMDL